LIGAIKRTTAMAKVVGVSFGVGAKGLWVDRKWAYRGCHKRRTARDMPRYVTSRYVTSIFVFPQEMQLLRFLPLKTL